MDLQSQQHGGLLPNHVLQINVSPSGIIDLRLVSAGNYAGETFALISSAFGGIGAIVHS
jgi:hypothetical protein